MENSSTANLSGLLSALNSSAERLQTLWFFFLTLTLYLVVATLTTTHRMSLINEAQSLPIVSLKVPLLPFYAITPLLYVIIHLYALTMLMLLARTAAVFDAELKAVFPINADQERYRAQIQNTIFAQLLVGMALERQGRNSFVLLIMAFLTLVIAPTAMLLVLQLQFLPYHHLAMTWWHRILITVDALAVVILWSAYRYSAGEILYRGSAPLARASLLLFMTVLVGSIAFYEGRWTGEPLIGRRDPGGSYRSSGHMVLGIFPDHLIVGGQSIVDVALLKQRGEEQEVMGLSQPATSLDFSYRDLSYAELSHTILRLANFSSASLDHADISYAQMEGANLSNADMRSIKAALTEFDGDDMEFANLLGADLSGASLRRVKLNGSRAIGADFSYANLIGAELRSISAWGASFKLAHLQFAWIDSAGLDGTSFRNADLQGAEISESSLRNANFGEALMFKTRITEHNEVISSDSERLRHVSFHDAQFNSSRERAGPDFGKAITQDDVDRLYDDLTKGVGDEDYLKHAKR